MDRTRREGERHSTGPEHGDTIADTACAELTEPSLEPFFRLSLDLLCIADTDGYFRRVSPAFRQLLGYSEEHLTRRAFIDFVHPEDRAATRSVLEGLTRGESVIRFENRYVCADGTHKWLQWTASPEPAGKLLYAVARDVTAERVTEERLREREQRLSEAQAISGVGSWSWDLTTGTLTWSEQLYRLLGLAPFEVQPSLELYLSMICEPDRALVRQKASRDSREPYTIEYRLQRPDSEQRVVQAHGRVILGKDGAPLRQVGTVQDITERKHAEKESRLLARVTQAISGAYDLRETMQTTLRELCESENWDYGEVWFPRADGSALEHFAAYARQPEQMKVFREASETYTCEPMVTLPGRVWATGIPEWHADLSDAGEDVFCRADLARRVGLRTCVGIPLCAELDVAAVLVLLRHRPGPEDPRQVSVFATITAQLGALLRHKQAQEALRRSEERFQLAALATNDAIYDWDLATDAVEFAESMQRKFGHAVQRTSSAWWSDQVHPDDRAAMWQSVQTAIDGGAQLWVGEYRFRRVDGSYAHVMDRGYLLRGPDGKGVRMIGSMLDQSERVRAAEVLREAKEAAEAAARAKSEFLANMSHEIRTPLTAVLGFADLLLDPKIGQSERLNYAMIVRRNGEHLLALLNDILDISKIEAGKLQTETIVCSPTGLLSDVASLMRVRAVEKGLLFEVQYQGAIPARVRTDPTRLRQILLNLVSNAIKFTEQGHVRVLARCQDGEADDAQLTIGVEDTGIGISDEQRSILFKPFAQADASMTRRYGGTGLGLGICAPLAAALGGAIQVESELGRGSTFTLRIPVRVERGTPRLSSPTEALTASADAASGSLLADPGQGSTVLLAEDGRDNQILIERVLRKHGFVVTIVENGRLAVDRALSARSAGQPYDVVLMDMQMPKLDGYGAATQLRANGYTGPIIALTAHAMSGERERCLAAGCSDYLTKPINSARLIDTIRTHVQTAHGAQPSHAAIVDRLPAPEGPLPEPRRADEMTRPGTEPPLVSTFADDADMAEIVAAFVEGLPAQVSAVSEAFRRGDRALLAQLSHQLKGAAGGYGFPTITEAAARLEELARVEPLPGETESALHEFAKLGARVRKGPVGPAGEAAPTLLAIDDSPQIHLLIEARLRAEGIEIRKALDAAEGLRLAREYVPDLILLDLELPDSNGLAVCRALRSDPITAAIPVIFLTGASDANIKAAALDSGAVDYVTKPFDAVELRARVRSALRAKRYQDLLATRAQVDGLTGLWNRAYFDARLREEMATCIRHGTPLSVAMVDLDHFKRINDSYGHPFGDQALQSTSRVLRSVLRSSDIVCRYGGEEFGLILRDTNPSAALTAAQRICSAVAGIVLSLRGQRISVTTSVGMATAPHGSSVKGTLAPALVAAADAALYRAKHEGRNRAVAVSLDD